MKKQMSGRRGATIERGTIINKIRRLKNENATRVDVQRVLNDLEVWIYERDTRFKRKKGGL